MELASFSHAYGQCAYHIVLVPYRRRKVFTNLAGRMETIFQSIAHRYNLTIHALKVKPDHVHLFVSIPPTLSLSKLFQILKGLSSYMLFKELPGLRRNLEGRLWSAGKFFRSIGSVTDEAVQYYIENQ